MRLLAAAAVAAVLAASGARGSVEEHFRRADANGDGVLSMEEFSTLSRHLLPSGSFRPAVVEAEPTFYHDEAAFASLLEVAAKEPATDNRAAMLAKRARHPGGCYRTCPTPVVFNNGEAFGGPFGPDPYYSYGQNHMY